MTAPEVPAYLTEEGSNQTVVLNRLLDAMQAAGYDRTEGEFAWDFESPVSVEAALIGIAMRFVLQVGFAQTSFGDYLTARAAERGVDRRPAVAATGVVRFTAPAFSVIPFHTVVSTTATATSPAQTFQTDAVATVASGDTSVDVAVTAVVPGSAGNVPPAAVRLLSSTAPGVTAVTNPDAFSGGADVETDDALLERYMIAVRSSSAGGNRADHIKWATDVPGVGGANVSYPTEGSPPVEAGGVRVSIVDSSRAPASNALIRDVIDSVVDPVRIGPYEGENFSITNANGVSIDGSQVDDSGSSLLTVYSATAAGAATLANIHQQLTQSGVWMLKFRAKVNSAAGSTSFYRIGVWNVSTAAWADISPSNTTDAVKDWKANELATTFPASLYEDAWYSQDFYWNGSDQLEVRLTRLQADTTTQVWLDQVRYRSVFSDDTGDGKAPAGQRVYVRAATPVSINVSADLTIASGYTQASVEDQIEANLTDYLRGLAFGTQNDVQYARVGTVILDTPGVADYTTLTVNGGTANISINSEQVAVLGTATWS